MQLSLQIGIHTATVRLHERIAIPFELLELHPDILARLPKLISQFLVHRSANCPTVDHMMSGPANVRNGSKADANAALAIFLHIAVDVEVDGLDARDVLCVEGDELHAELVA